MKDIVLKIKNSLIIVFYMISLIYSEYNTVVLVVGIMLLISVAMEMYYIEKEKNKDNRR